MQSKPITVGDVAIATFGSESKLLSTLATFAEGSARAEGLSAPSYAYEFVSRPRRLPKPVRKASPESADPPR